jgi:hypothetical protein
MERLDNQVNPMIQTLFPNNVGLFQDNNSLIHTCGTVQSWFEEHEGELNLPWLAQSTDLNIIEPLCSVLETTAMNRFPPPTNLMQFEDVIQEELYKIPLETVQNLYESIRRKIVAVLKAKVVQHHINKEMCTVPVVVPLFCPTPVCIY